MKTITQITKQNKKIVALSVMLIAISTISFSQIRNFKDLLVNNVKEKFSQADEINNTFLNVSYYEAAEWNESPVISRTILVNSVDISYEDNMEVEEWMTSTFENYLENSVEIEAWMTAPFDALIEKDIKVENWMNDPFTSCLESSIDLEGWMTAPFETSLEENITVENWMNSPFEISMEDDIEIENWMSNPMAFNN